MNLRVVRAAKRWLRPERLPARVQKRVDADRSAVLGADPGTERVLPALMQWLALAQDQSRSCDGGVARHYSLVDGWSTSYPETTGYIIPTLFAYADFVGDEAWRRRALRMADWLVSIQLPQGGFQGGRIDSLPVAPVTFNTGQILLGLAAAEREAQRQGSAGRYLLPMRLAADWLVHTQDEDGCWRRHESPFAARGEKQYETHVAWGLFEAARVDNQRGYREAGMRNVHWAIRDLPSNGWFDRCTLSDSKNPLTHTLGYALRGVIEAHRISTNFDAPSEALLDAALRTAKGLRSALRDDGWLPGMLDDRWRAVASWSCLTGSAQVALCWLYLYEVTGDHDWLDAAVRANHFLRRTVSLSGAAEHVGAVRGSYPIDGGYGRYEYLNWAAKFLADSLMEELRLKTAKRPVSRFQPTEGDGLVPNGR